MKVPFRIRSFFYQFFPPVLVFNKMICLLFAERSFLRRSGYIKSIMLRRPCRADGSPIPWMNYGVVAFLEDRLTRDLSLFEYGSGNSTLFFAQRVKDVVSVENNQAWYDYCVKNKPENVKLVFCESDGTEKYAGAIIEEVRRFDVVVIDGEDRSGCLLKAHERLTSSGVIVLDDTHNLGTGVRIKDLLEVGFRRLDFEGVKAGGVRFYRTTILYRDGNCLGI